MGRGPQSWTTLRRVLQLLQWTSVLTLIETMKKHIHFKIRQKNPLPENANKQDTWAMSWFDTQTNVWNSASSSRGVWTVMDLRPSLSREDKREEDRRKPWHSSLGRRDVILYFTFIGIQTDLELSKVCKPFSEHVSPVLSLHCLSKVSVSILLW